MKELSIGDVARYAGIETSAIRFYERVGLMPPPRRLKGRNRRYDLSILKRLGLIQLLRETGFSIREIQILFEGGNAGASSTGSWRSLAAQKISELDALIKRTEAAKQWLEEISRQDCNCPDDCIVVTLSDGGQGMNITLSCIDAPPAHDSTGIGKRSRLENR